MNRDKLPLNATDLDLDAYWEANQQGLLDPFGSSTELVPCGIQIGYEAAFAELGLEEDNWRLTQDFAFACEMARNYNERAKRIVGRPILDENRHDPSRKFPDHPPLVGELFGCENLWEGQSWWLKESVSTPSELDALLDRVDALDLESVMFPDGFDEQCQKVTDRHGIQWGQWHGLRGPVTLATSIYGAENLLFLILDEPELAARFRDVLLKTILAYHTIADRRSHAQPVASGFMFFDDNCCLLNPEMYAFFGQPIVKAVYDRFAPGPDDLRYQHSDSDMAHLLLLLAETGMNRVNFGPNVRVTQIRQAMPKAIIEGTLAPFTFMRNEHENIIEEVKRDCEETRPGRGLVEATAGSVNDGTSLASMRCVMEALVKYGQYS